MSKLGERIKERREQMGLSQPQLSQMCGWESQSRISNYEKGTREPKINDLLKIAKALKCAASDLLDTPRESKGDQVSVNETLHINKNIITIHYPSSSWSAYCIDKDSNIYKKELLTMTVDKDTPLTDRCYIIEVDTDSFRGIPVGHRLLVDPDRQPVEGNTIIISKNNGLPTLAKWRPGLDADYLESLGSGQPDSIQFDPKKYTILGVILGSQPRFNSWV